MDYTIKILKAKGNRAVIEFPEQPDWSKLYRLAKQVQPEATLTVDDHRQLTAQQRRKIFALMGDISEWSGYDPKETEEVMKYRYMALNHDYFSLSKRDGCSVDTARMFIDMLLVFCFQERVPFASETWDSLSSDFKFQYLCLIHKKCVLDGKPADIAHVDSVGIGRNRKTMSHLNKYVMPLCRVHHQESHQVGTRRFMEKHHIKGIRVTPEIAKLLRLGNWQLSYTDPVRM